MCTLNDFSKLLKGKVIDKATLESDCGGEFIHIVFTDNTTMNIQDTSEGTESLHISILNHESKELHYIPKL